MMIHGVVPPDSVPQAHGELLTSEPVDTIEELVRRGSQA